MDVVLELLDPLLFDRFYSSLGISSISSGFSEQDYWPRQLLSLFLILWIGGYIMYFVFASLSYLLIFDRKERNHRQFLQNQELLEIEVSLKSIPIMAIFSCGIFLGEVRGYSKLNEYPIIGLSGLLHVAFMIVFYLVFTDTLIYWIHKALHHPILYGPIHKLHHKWIITTPFASHAFHPVDGFSQSIPYHIFVFLFPLNKWVYVFLFVFVNFWTISIHDGSGYYNGKILNGASHHTIHHRKFNYNYGQYFTFWDRLCNTHRAPTPEEYAVDTKFASSSDETKED
jgi:lathosterol oxidase